MESNIQGLLKSFDAFLKYSKYVFENNNLEITYSFWCYDLIDEDLDFDEAYYDRIVEQFSGFLDDFVRKHVIITRADAAVIKNKNITRHEDVFESKIEYAYVDDTTVQRTKTHFVKVK